MIDFDDLTVCVFLYINDEEFEPLEDQKAISSPQELLELIDIYGLYHLNFQQQLVSKFSKTRGGLLKQVVLDFSRLLTIHEEDYINNKLLHHIH